MRTCSKCKGTCNVGAPAFLTLCSRCRGTGKMDRMTKREKVLRRSVRYVARVYKQSEGQE